MGRCRTSVNGEDFTALRPAGRALALTLLFSPMAAAVTVHTWIDGAGIRHYSDAPPAGSVADTGQIVIADTPATEARAEDDYYSIANQWQRLRDERRESDALRLEHDRLEARARARAQTPADEAPPYDRGYRNFPYYSPYGFGRHLGHHAPHGFDPAQRGRSPGFAARRRNAFVHATPPVWPRQRSFPR
jgi:hypothetical protein